MLSDPYEFIWRPQRPARPHEQLDADLERLTNIPLERIFSFEDRLVVRELLHLVLPDPALRELFDGLLLPPPYPHPSLEGRRWTSDAVAALVGRLDPSLDGVVVGLPLNVAGRIGAYGARLRAGAQRLCWILNIPMTRVEAQERRWVQFYEAHRQGETAPAGSDPQADIDERRTRQKRGLRRVATVAGFSALGGAALLVTGGLAAPMVSTAYAALSGGVATTMGAIAGLGGAVLGTGVSASVFAAAVGLTTHAAALTSLLTPVLTVGPIASIFGVTGAVLSGYRAYRRTDDSGVFLIRAVDEVETLPAMEELSQPSLSQVVALSTPSQKGFPWSLGWDLSDAIQDSTRSGIVVPEHTFLVAAANLRGLSNIREYRRHIVFGVLAQLPECELRLQAMKLTTGVWALLPPPVIPYGHAGLFACTNRRLVPTGTGFVLCYVATSIGGGGAIERATQRVWVRAHCDFFGDWELSCIAEDASVALDPLQAEARLKDNIEIAEFTKTTGGMTMTVRHQPVTYLKLSPFLGIEGLNAVTFPVRELVQHMSERDCDVQSRRKVGVAIVNQSTHMVCVREVSLVTGAQWRESALPQPVESHTALLEFFRNQDWDLRGVEGFYILEVRNTNDNPLTDVYFVRLQFVISALNNLGLSVAAAPTVSELKATPLATESPKFSDFEVGLGEGLFFSLGVRIVAKYNTIQLRVMNFVERHVDEQVVQKEARLTVGICGYTSIFDPRRSPQDQQVGLWKAALADLRLVGTSEAYAIQWEDEYLGRFGKDIDVELDIVNQVGHKAFSEVKKVIKRELMRGAIFSGLRAFKSLMGSIAIPIYIIQAFSAIDNAFATLSNRAVFAGLDLAKALLSTRVGHRPVTLIGFSFGSKVVCECLLELHRVGAFDLIDNVFLIGSTVPADTDVWMRMREVVAGRLVNLYTRIDWVLWLMYKANETDLKPMAGMSAINLPGIENVDVTPIVERHRDYGFKLRDVLNLIPLQPTEDTWSKKDLCGSPGIIVSSSERGKTMKIMAKSLVSVLSSTPFCVFSLLNGFASDKADFDLPLELLSFSVLDGFFDFRPPQSVPPLSAGVFGAIGESGVDRIGGVVSFIARLDEFSERDIMLIIFFYVMKDIVSVVVYPSLVMRRESGKESSEEAKMRLSTITSQAFEDLDDIQKICNSETALRAGVNKVMAQSIKVPMDRFFTDGHKQATIFIDLERVSDGVSICIRALLTKTSSQPQQEHFTEEALHSLYDQVIPVEEKEIYDVAKVYPIDDIQNKLIAIAGKLDGARAKDGPQAKEEDTQRNSPEASLSDAGSTIIPVVVANRSEVVPLYFFEPEILSGDEPKTVDGDSVNAAELTSLNADSMTSLHAPPLKLPPQSFCVMMLRDLVCQSSHCVRYATVNGDCYFEIYAAKQMEAARDVANPKLVKCDRISGYNNKVAVSTSTARIDGTLFQEVFMEIKTAEKTNPTTNLVSPSVSEQLKLQGWFVV